MANQRADTTDVCLHGEIVEIVEEAGRRVAKIVVAAPVVVDMTREALVEAHLGDRVLVRGWIAAIGGHKEDV